MSLVIEIPWERGFDFATARSFKGRDRNKQGEGLQYLNG